MISDKLFTYLLFSIIFTILLSGITLSETHFEEGIHLIRPSSAYIPTGKTFPEYLSVEDITFLGCTEDDHPLRSSVLCLDNNNFQDLDSYKWTSDQNCYVSSFNLKDFKCKNMVIQVEYTKNEENYRLTKKVKRKKLTKVLDHVLGNQFSDGGWRDSLSTAHGIWALSYYKDIFDYEIGSAMRWLKLNRNEEMKCWPKSPCDILHTANILALLSLSNYTDYYRILNDGQNYIEEMQNYYDQSDTWKAGVYPLVPFTTLTLVSYDETILDENFTLLNNTWKEYSFTTEIDKRLLIISDENVKARIVNQEGETLINYQGDNLSYTIPGACWSRNKKGEPCNLRTTLYNTIVDIPDVNIDEAKIYLENELLNSSLVGKFVGIENDSIDTSLFLYVMYPSYDSSSWMTEIVDWLTYHQNNEGSWGSNNITDKALPTAYATMALRHYGFNTTSEQVEDAEEWASDNEESTDYNDTITQSALLSVLRNNARPIVTTSPRVITIRDAVTEIDVFNPTTFNLKDVDYKFSENLKDILIIEKKSEIYSYSYRKLNIKKKGAQKSTIYGYLTITNLNKEVGKIPVIVSDFPALNVSYSDNLYVFGQKSSIDLTAKKSTHEFICDVTWTSSEISTPGSFKISTETASIPIVFDDAVTKEEVYRGTLSCKQGDSLFEFPLSVFFMRYSTEPLDVSTDTLTINTTTQDIIVMVKNNLDIDIEVSVTMDPFSELFNYPDSINLNPNEERNLSLINTIPPQDNVSGTTAITFTSLTRSKAVSVSIDITHGGKGRMDLIRLIIILFFVTTIIATMGYLTYRYRDEIIKYLNKLNFLKMRKQVEVEKKEIGEMRDEELYMIIVNTFKLMRFQEKDDKEIKETLLKNFTQAQVKDALEKSGNTLPGIDEEEPEKVE